MPSLKKFEAAIKEIMEKNKWSQTPNVTLLEAARNIIKATDKWRRCHPNEEVIQEILESIFFLVSTCVKLGNNVDLDKLFEQICKSKETFAFEGVPDDLVWSFILFATEPHFAYRKEPTAIQ